MAMLRAEEIVSQVRHPHALPVVGLIFQILEPVLDDEGVNMLWCEPSRAVDRRISQKSQVEVMLEAMNVSSVLIPELQK